MAQLTSHISEATAASRGGCCTLLVLVILIPVESVEVVSSAVVAAASCCEKVSRSRSSPSSWKRPPIDFRTAGSSLE